MVYNAERLLFRDLFFYPIRLFRRKKTKKKLSNQRPICSIAYLLNLHSATYCSYVGTYKEKVVVYSIFCC